MDEVFEAVIEVIRVLKRLQVDYLIGGSLASSFHGIPRSTQDADLVADLRSAHISALSEALRDRFYLDEAGIREAVRRRSSFNLIYLKTMFKVDIFVLKDDPFSREEMRRRKQVTLDQIGGESLEVASAEDTILHKLAWYQLGGGVSDRQWNDLLGVLKVRRHDLSLDYLQRWSRHLGVHELLRKALQDAGFDETRRRTE
ncbi:MAG: hypothetical protein V3T83_04550 [Acidobacteriota bacterium]